MNEIVNRATQILNQSGILIFPTDTAFGIGCRIDKPDTVKRLFEIRKRPINQAMPVLVGSREMACYYYKQVSVKMQKLMDSYWPGALTIVSECNLNLIDELIRVGGSTVGLRMPNHAELLQVINTVGVPILGSSANFHGQPTPFKIEEIDRDLIRLVDGIMPGECSLNQVSTVIECRENDIKIIRQGAVNLKI